MEIILLETVSRLGHPGEIVTVRKGYARNFLLPYGKAKLATAQNREEIAKLREEFAAKARAVKEQAVLLLGKIHQKTVTLFASVSESGLLYGSVGTNDIAAAIFEQLAITVERKDVHLPEGNIKKAGSYVVVVDLHPEVKAEVSLLVQDEKVAQSGE